MKTSAYMRDTRHEIRTITQRANGWHLGCSDRSAAPVLLPGGRLQAVQMPELYVPEEQFTQDEHDIIIAAFALLERGYANVYDAHAADVPQRTKEQVAAFLEAQSKLDELEQSLEAKRAAADAEHALIDLQLAQKRAQLEAP